MATELTVLPTYVANWGMTGYAPAVGETVQVLWLLTDDGIDDDGFPRLHGTGPTVPAIVYAWDSLDGRFEDGAGLPLPTVFTGLTVNDGPYLLYIPQFQIDPTADWIRPKPGHYRVFFNLPDGRKVMWQDFQDIVVQAGASPLNLSDISTFNKSGVPMPNNQQTYTKEVIDQKIAAVAAGALVNPMTAVGDLIYGGTVVATKATPTRVGIIAGRILGVVAGLPAWILPVLADVASWLGYTPENAANKGASNGYAALATGKVPTAQLGSGTPSATTYLAGDQTFKNFSAGIDSLLVRILAGTVQMIAGTGTGAVDDNATIVITTSVDTGTPTHVQLPLAFNNPGRIIIYARLSTVAGSTHDVVIQGPDTITDSAGALVASVAMAPGGWGIFIGVPGANKWRMLSK